MFYKSESDKILIKTGQNPIYLSFHVPKFSAYYAYFIKGGKNFLIGLKGINRKEADYQEAIRNSNLNLSPKEWLKNDPLHNLRLVFSKLKNAPEHLTFDKFDNYQSNLEKAEWIVLNGLHVHHVYYQRGKLAWQYPLKALITLCWNCHQKLHEASTVKVYDEHFNHITNYSVCDRCYGAGWFPKWQLIEEGICFGCYGAKYKELIV